MLLVGEGTEEEPFVAVRGDPRWLSAKESESPEGNGRACRERKLVLRAI